MEDGRANFGIPETLWLMPGYSSGVSVTEAQLTERALALAKRSEGKLAAIGSPSKSVYLNYR